MNEFELINQLQRRVNGWVPAEVESPLLGIGDDAAVLQCPAGQQLVVTVDTLVEGVHFVPLSSAADIGFKALAVNLSDLAAMGATPAWFFLALTLPEVSPRWIDAFSHGLSVLSEQSRIQLCGGDTTSGPLSVTITAMGLVNPGEALTRGGARPGDLVVVSGFCGLASYALKQIEQGARPAEKAVQAMNRPEPRLKLGRLLAGKANACIDISDGLAADLTHIAKASGLGAEIELWRLPVPAELAGLPQVDRWEHQLGGGDDYELCFTLSPEREAELKEWAEKADVELTVIGRTTPGSNVLFLREDGGRFSPARRGFDHFPDVQA